MVILVPENFDALEVRSADQRAAEQLSALRALLQSARSASPAVSELLADMDVSAISDFSALAALPIMRKTELLARQRSTIVRDPFGGFSTATKGEGLLRVFASPGPVYEPQGADQDYWRTARALNAAGFRRGDLVHNSFSYHMTPGAFMFEAGALALGCTVFPAGIGQTDLQLSALRDLRADAYCGTPGFLRILLEKAEEAGIEFPYLRTAAVSGEACPPSLVGWFADRSVGVFQSYATAELGLIAYETSAREGLVLDEGVIVEIVLPGTAIPAPFGEVGEVVVTALNPVYPLLRYSTGDLSAFIPGHCPTGRTAQRIKGWLGRADQSVKVKGMFVHPLFLSQLVHRIPEILKCRLIVYQEGAVDCLRIQVETGGGEPPPEERIARVFKELSKLSAVVELVMPGTLPNDGRQIIDERNYE